MRIVDCGLEFAEPGEPIAQSPNYPTTQFPNDPMSQQPNDPNALISGTLKAGVAISFTLLLIGLLWTVEIMVTGGQAPAPVAQDPVSGAVRGNVVALLAGLLVLMATPVLRIVAALWYFEAARDRRYAFISATVLFIVLASILLSLIQKRAL
jgi:uncharacterized membrane protein